MIRKLLSTAVLAAVVAIPASAQSPFQQSFTATATSSYDAFAGHFNSPSTPTFQIFCVDEVDVITDPFTYDVWVTPMASSDFSYTHGHNGSGQANYIEAATIASNMLGGASAGDVADIQNAIWYAMGFGTGTVGNYNTWLDAGKALNGGALADASEWAIISDFDGAHSNGSLQQEFIANISTPQETVPEPATMTLLATGLVGMGAARRKRNKKS